MAANVGADDAVGPVMLVATNILRPPPARVGRISEKIVLPRTVELRKLIAAGAGVFAGMFFWVFPIGLFFRYSLSSLMFCAAGFAFLAVFLISWSPLRGESFARWLGLSAGSIRADRVRIDGLRVRAYIGVAPLSCTAAGRTRVVPGAVDVPVGSVDERGVAYPQDEYLRRLKSSTADFPVVPLREQGFEEPKPLPM